MLSVILLIVVLILAYRAAPREKKEDEHIHGAGQIGLIGALALFGVDYFTAYCYTTLIGYVTIFPIRDFISMTTTDQLQIFQTG